MTPRITPMPLPPPRRRRRPCRDRVLRHEWSPVLFARARGRPGGRPIAERLDRRDPSAAAVRRPGRHCRTVAGAYQSTVAACWPVARLRLAPTAPHGLDRELGYAGRDELRQDDLARLARAEEVEIETQAPDGPAHRTIIWIVVDGDEVFVRSSTAPDGRWYPRGDREPRRRHPRRRPASAGDRDPGDRSRLDRADHRRADRRNTQAISRHAGRCSGHDVLDTTLRLEPA